MRILNLGDSFIQSEEVEFDKTFGSSSTQNIKIQLNLFHTGFQVGLQLQYLVG